MAKRTTATEANNQDWEAIFLRVNHYSNMQKKILVVYSDTKETDFLDLQKSSQQSLKRSHTNLSTCLYALIINVNAYQNS